MGSDASCIHAILVKLVRPSGALWQGPLIYNFVVVDVGLGMSALVYQGPG